MKKLICIGLSLLMVLTMVSVAVATMAAGAVAFTVSTVQKQGGETIPAGTKFDITVTTNAIPELYAVELKLCYDKAQLKAVSATKSGLLSEMDYAQAELNPAAPVMDPAVYGEVWLTGMTLSAASASANEVMSTITFEALTDITTDAPVQVCAAPVVGGDAEGNTQLTATYVDGGVKFAIVTTTTAAVPDDTADRVSLLPSNASDFTTLPGGQGEITVSETGNDVFKFTTDKGWPQAYYAEPDETKWVTVDTADPDAKLYWDFTVSKEANVLVYFEGQDPASEGGAGTYVSLNGIIDATKLNPDGTVKDLGAGTYKGSIAVSELGCREDLMTDGKFRISGVKVFAVGGTVVVNELSAVGESAKKVTTTVPTTVTTAADTTTTVAGGEATTTVAAPTTTVKRAEDTSKNDAPKTADVTEMGAFALVGVLAAIAVAMATTMKKTAAR